MHTRYILTLVAGLSALTLSACEQDPVPAIPVADFRRPEPVDARVRFDRGAGGDQGTGGVGGDAGPTDLGPDVALDMLPPTPGPAEPSAVRVLSVRADTRVGWIAQSALWSARIDRFGVLTDTQRVTDVPGVLRGPVLGGRTATGPAWITVADGPDGMWRAYDLSEEAPTAVETAIYGDARVVTTATTVLLFGRTGPEPDAPLAWRALTADPSVPLPEPDLGVDAGTDDAGPLDAAVADAGPPDPRRIDTLGLGVPEHTIGGLSNVVLGFADGLCAVLLPSLNIGEAWRCHARRDAHPVGDKSQIFFVGNHRGDVVLWQAMPGASLPPGTVIEVEPDPEADAGVDAGLDAGADAAVDLDAEVPPEAQPLPASAVLVPGGEIVNWLSPMDGAEVARIRGADGEEAIWLFEASRIRVVPLTAELAGVQAVATNRRSLFGLSWDEAGTLSVTPLTEQPGPLPPIFVPAAVCGGQVEPEDCSALDRDCDGNPRGGRCCVNTVQRRTEARLPAPRLAVDAWVAGFDLERVLMAIPRADKTELYRMPAAEVLNSINPFLQWPGSGTPRLISTEQGRVVALRDLPVADPPPDPPEENPPATAELLWWIGADSLDDSTTPPTGPVSPAPCGPVLALRLFNPAEGAFARVYCAESAFDVPYADRENPIARPYPDGAVRWIVDRAFAGVDLLVASGDDFVLSRLTETLDGIAPSPEPLPDTLASLINTERTLPIRPPVALDGWYARVRDNRVQIWVAERGWQSMPSTRWPLSAEISPFDPIALSVVQVNDPALATSPGAVALDVRLHHLGPNAAPWGRPPRTGAQQTLEASGANGLRLGSFSVTAFNRPVLLRMFGPVQSGFTGEAVQCD